MKYVDALNHLDPTKWAKTDLETRVKLIDETLDNLDKYVDELAASDADMKGYDEKNEYLRSTGYMTTIVPIAMQLNAVKDLYNAELTGEAMEGMNVTKVDGQDKYDINVFPFTPMDRMSNQNTKGYIRVVGEPIQTKTLDREAGIVAVLGAGNYSSAIEMVKAMFLDNKTVVHRPHHMNQDTDYVWEKVFKPLIDYGAVAFCESKGSRELVKDERITKIYFTGGAETAQKIMSTTDTPFISECGGNNPVIIVPGDRNWTPEEIAHQAIKFATIAKMNGGAICGRMQTIITSKNWSQREAFINALRKAIEEDTPAVTSHYPTHQDVMKNFKANNPTVEVLRPEGGSVKESDFLFISNCTEDSYAVSHEAFCQIMNEVPLDVEGNTETFLEAAVEFANNKVLGSLGAMILVDDDTLAVHIEAVEKAVSDLQYGGISVNTIPPFIFLNPYLTWGGNEEGKEFCSGSGNFGNLMNYENVEKSMLWDSFISQSDMIHVSKKGTAMMAKPYAMAAVKPSQERFGKVMEVVGQMMELKKDF